MPPFPNELAILNKMVGANAITNEEREELSLERAAAATPVERPVFSCLCSVAFLSFLARCCAYQWAPIERGDDASAFASASAEPPARTSVASVASLSSTHGLTSANRCHLPHSPWHSVAILNTNGTRSRCSKCVDGLPSRLRRAYVLVGDSLDRNLVYNLCTSKSGAQYVPVCGAKNSFVCSLRDGKTAWLNFFLFGLLVPQHKTAPGAFFGDEPRLAHERITTLLPRMLANINDSQTELRCSSAPALGIRRRQTRRNSSTPSRTEASSSKRGG